MESHFRDIIDRKWARFRYRLAVLPNMSQELLFVRTLRVRVVEIVNLTLFMQHEVPVTARRYVGLRITSAANSRHTIPKTTVRVVCLATELIRRRGGHMEEMEVSGPAKNHRHFIELFV